MSALLLPITHLARHAPTMSLPPAAPHQAPTTTLTFGSAQPPNRTCGASPSPSSPASHLTRLLLIVLLNANTLCLANSATLSLTIDLVSVSAAVYCSAEVLGERRPAGPGTGAARPGGGKWLAAEVRAAERLEAARIVALVSTVWAAFAVGRAISEITW